MQSLNHPGIGLQNLQEPDWSFRPQDAAADMPNAPLRGAAAVTSPTTQPAADFATILSPSSGIGHPENEDSVILRRDRLATPPKTPRRSKKRKVANPNGNYRSSAKKTKSASTSTPTTPKPSRKTDDYYDETEYKPTSKPVKKHAWKSNDEEDADFCHDACEEKDEQDMIHCDGEACRLGGKWFHTRCVGFGRVLPSNMDEFEWYCPTCREEFGVGEETNGLVHRGGMVSSEGLMAEPRRLRSTSDLPA